MQANTRFLASLTAVLCAAAAACADATVSPNQDNPGVEAAEGNVANAPATSSEAPQIVDDVGVISEAVVGGKESAPCGWPSTVDISGCTGTLIHPRVVTTAAHCLYGSSAMIKFTAGGKTPGSFTVMGQCKSGAFGSSGGSTGRDWGYCVLPDDPRIKMMQITPPIVGCEADRYLKPGNTAWVVGFGTTGSGLNDNGIKREVEVKINKVQDGTVDIGDKDVGACHGDSGGPLYIKVTDGTHDWGWRVAGSTSGAGGNCDCACSTVYVDIRQHVKAIEMNEKIDVTPCTDADGKWAPGPDCKDFITDPSKGTGTYPMCSAPVTHEPIASCGEPSAGGAAGAAGGAAMGPAAGSGGSAGAGAAAAAGSGAVKPGVGAAGARAAGGVAGAGVATAGSAAPATGIGVTGLPGAAAGAGAVVAAAGRAAPAVGTAGASATTARAGSGAIGMSVSGVTAAGSGAVVATAPAAEESSSSSGCSVAGSSDNNATWLLGLLFAVALRSVRRRQRRGALVA